MTNADKERAKHFADVLNAMHRAEQHGGWAWTAGTINRLRLRPSSTRGTAATLREMTERKLVASNHELARSEIKAYQDSPTVLPHTPDAIAYWQRLLNQRNTYSMTVAGRIAHDMMRREFQRGLAAGHTTPLLPVW